MCHLTWRGCTWMTVPPSRRRDAGKISFEEFLPLCFNLLVEIVSLDYESEALPRDEKEIKDFFMALFTQVRR